MFVEVISNKCVNKILLIHWRQLTSNFTTNYKIILYYEQRETIHDGSKCLPGCIYIYIYSHPQIDLFRSIVWLETLDS